MIIKSIRKNNIIISMNKINEYYYIKRLDLNTGFMIRSIPYKSIQLTNRIFDLLIMD